jgi:hypothetical protein
MATKFFNNLYVHAGIVAAFYTGLVTGLLFTVTAIIWMVY